jgi:hypothetical protein
MKDTELRKLIREQIIDIIKEGPEDLPYFKNRSIRVVVPPPNGDVINIAKKLTELKDSMAKFKKNEPISKEAELNFKYALKLLIEEFKEYEVEE